MLAQLRVDRVLPRRNCERTHVFSKGAQVIVDLLDDCFWVFTRKQEVQQLSTSLSVPVYMVMPWLKHTWKSLLIEHSIPYVSYPDP